MSVRVYRVVFAVLVLSLCASALMLVPWRESSSTTASAALTSTNTFSVATTNSLATSFTSAFVPNVGQTADSVTFQTNAMGGTVFFTEDAIVLALPTTDPTKAPVPDSGADERQPEAALPDPLPPTVLRVRFDGANTKPAINGTNRLPGVINIIKGGDPDNWHTGIPTYAGVVYEDIYPGIDLHYESEAGHLKGTYHVAPGADPRQIRWQYDGTTDAMRVDPATGSMQVPVPAPPDANVDSIGVLEEQAPVAWQEDHNQRQDVTVSYSLDRSGWVSFDIGEYDPSQPLILDPLMRYSTYLGGANVDRVNAVAVGRNEDVFIAGYTISTDFPSDPVQGPNGGYDVFVARLKEDGSDFIYGTYLGDIGSDYGEGIAEDSNGNAYVTGRTFSTDFPTTTGVLAENDLPGTDAFVARLNQAGAVVYSTYLGGDGTDEGYAIAVDAERDAYVTGLTYSTDLVPPGIPSFQDDYADRGDAFITKISDLGTSIIYSTYIGGSRLDRGNGIALDDDKNAYIVGDTDSSATTFPLKNPRQGQLGGSIDAFISKLNAAGDDLVYSTYHGGTRLEFGKAIAVDSDRQMYITGQTQSASSSFPLASPLQNGVLSTDAFVSKFNATGNSLIYSTYLGGGGVEEGTGIAVDRFGQAHVTGFSSSSNFPNFPSVSTLPELPAGSGGTSNAFVATYHPQGRAIMHSSTLGGNGRDRGTAIAVGSRALETPDPQDFGFYYVEGINHIAGYTLSSNFPTYNAQDDTRSGFAEDGFVTKLSPYPAATTSYYMTTVNPVTLYNRGAARGERDRERFGTQDSFVVLFFGAPEVVITGTETLTGTKRFAGGQEEEGVFVSTQEIAAAVQEFGRGYVEGSAPEDTTSQLTLAIGTSNSRIDFDQDISYVTFEHGEVWAEMVNDVQQWFVDNGYADRVTAVGASNIELGWNPPVRTRAWVDGYLSVPDFQEFYNIGAAEGCPPAPGPCNGGWEEGDIWYVSWGASPFRMFAIPQIYANNGRNAEQWQEIASYSTVQPGGLMQFRGALTQYQSCTDKSNEQYGIPADESQCINADHIPEAGWRYLWTELNSNPNTRQPLRWSTDVRWNFPVEEY